MTDQNAVLGLALEDAGAGMQALNTEKISRVTTLSKRQVELEAEYALLETQAKSKKKELDDLSTNQLPAAMQEAGLLNFTLRDGSTVTVKKIYRGKVKEDDQPEAFDWMERHGHAAIINTDAIIRLGKGRRDKAQRILYLFSEYIKMLNQTGLLECEVTPILEESIAWNTLSAWLKEQIELRQDPDRVKELGLPPFPEDLFGTFIVDRATITPPKKETT